MDNAHGMGFASNQTQGMPFWPLPTWFCTTAQQPCPHQWHHHSRAHAAQMFIQNTKAQGIT